MPARLSTFATRDLPWLCLHIQIYLYSSILLLKLRCYSIKCPPKTPATSNNLRRTEVSCLIPHHQSTQVTRLRRHRIQVLIHTCIRMVIIRMAAQRSPTALPRAGRRVLPAKSKHDCAKYVRSSEWLFPNRWIDCTVSLLL